MAFRVSFDASACQAYANCLIEAPEVWDFDEEHDIAVLKDEHPEESLRAKVLASVRGCPAQAIKVEDLP